MVNSFFESVEKIILEFSEIINIYKTEKKKYNEIQGLISGSIIFMDNTKLSFLEFKNLDVNSKIKYKYHYMDKNNKLIFRYDNAKHHPEIDTFPHHVHTENKISESEEPELIDILIQINDNFF